MLLLIVVSLTLKWTSALSPEWTDERLLRLEKLVEAQESRISELEADARIKDGLIETLNRKFADCESNMVFQKSLPREIEPESDVVQTTDDLDIDKPIPKDKTAKRRIIREVDDVGQTLNTGSFPLRYNRRLLRSTSQTNAFSAHLHLNLRISSRQVIVFDEVLTTVGAGYNRHTGIFRAPMNGVYGFSCSLRVDSNSYLIADIFKNSEVQTTFLVGTAQYDHRYSSTTIVLQLTQGDVVYVKTKQNAHQHGYISTDAHGRSTFTGWQIQ